MAFAFVDQDEVLLVEVGGDDLGGFGRKESNGNVYTVAFQGQLMAPGSTPFQF